MTQSVDAELFEQITTILRRDLKLGAAARITPDMPLIGGEMDLDSLDILLLVSSVEKQFKIKIPNEVIGRWVFKDVGTLTQFIHDNRTTLSTAGGASALAATANIDWLSLLPHGPAFRFISKVSEVVPGQRASGHWSVDGAEEFFKAHFPGRPIVPGVLLTEALAQMAGLAGASTSAGGAGVLVHVDIRFEAPVMPPAVIELRAEVRSTSGALVQCDVLASEKGRAVARGTVTLQLTGAA